MPESLFGGTSWLLDEGVWYFGDIWHVFQILNASIGDLTDLGGVSEQLSGLKVSDGPCLGVWHVFGIAGVPMSRCLGPPDF